MEHEVKITIWFDEARFHRELMRRLSLRSVAEFNEIVNEMMREIRNYAVFEGAHDDWPEEIQ